MIDALYNQDTRQLSVQVLVDGVPLPGVTNVSWSFKMGQVPTATIVCNMEQYVQLLDGGSKLEYKSEVSIDVGFNGIMGRVFTGVILDIGKDKDATIECVGRSWILDLEYHTLVKTLSNVDANDAIEEMLQDAGAVSFFVDLPAWTVGVLKDRPLSFQTYSDAIMKIAEVELGRWFETSTGQIVVREAQPVPGIVAARTYYAGVLSGVIESIIDSLGNEVTGVRPRLRSVSMKTATREVKNEILVLGASLTTVDAQGDQISTRIQSTVTGPNQFVLAPDDTQALNALVFSNELIEDQAKADSVAVALFQLHNRLTTYMGVTIDGDPRVRLAETVDIEDPGYSGATGRWWVEGYSSRLSAAGFETALSLVGKEGSRTNWEPVADFTVGIDIEAITDAQYLVVTFDGRASYDFDGTIESYEWHDNQTPEIVTGTDSMVTVKVDPTTLTLPWEVSLTVTDNDGAVRTTSKTVDPVTAVVPGICVAGFRSESASPDGGQFWYDESDIIDADEGDRSISVAASPSQPGRAVWGSRHGRIAVTDDLLASGEVIAYPIPAQGADRPAVVDLEWDRSNPARVWALTIDGHVLLSSDYGHSWSAHSDLIIAAGQTAQTRTLIMNRMDSVFIGQTLCLRVYGGTGTGRPFIAWMMVPSSIWTPFQLGGDLLADILVSNDPALYVADGASDVSTELAIILNSTLEPAVYFTSDAFGNGSGWTRAQDWPAKSAGHWLDADLVHGRFAFGFDDDVIYTADLAVDGILYISAAAATLDAGDSAAHGLWVGRSVPGLAGVYLVCAGDFDLGTEVGKLYKTTDRFATIEKVRPSAIATTPPFDWLTQMSAIGLRRPSLSVVSLYAQQSPVSTTVQTYSPRVAGLVQSWTLKFDPVAASQYPVSFVRMLSGNLFRSKGPMAGDGGQKHPGNLEVSHDLGIAWNEVVAQQTNAGDVWGVQGLALAASGRLWLCTMADDPSNMALPVPSIQYSDDDGDTWTVSLLEETLDGDSGLRRQMIDICCHPQDPRVIFVIGCTGAGSRRSWHSIDGGANWTFVTDSSPNTVTECERQCVMMSNNRVILMDGVTGTMRYSDDYGATWLGSSTPGTTGPSVATAITQDGLMWNNVTPARLAALDNQRMFRGTLNSGPSPVDLRGFGFAIPASAEIVGIQVRINKLISGTGFAIQFRDETVQLHDPAGVDIGTDKAVPTGWNTTAAYTIYGGPTDLWGATLTPTIVNDPDFGLFFDATRTGAVNLNWSGWVDHIEMTVYYVEGISFDTIAYQLIRNAAGNVAFASGGAAGATSLRRSRDFGVSWEEIANGAPSPSPTVEQFAGLAYVDATDRLYVSTEVQNAAANRVFALDHAAAISVGAMIDLTVNLNDLFASATAAHRRVARQGIAVP